jgi:hypothetical protein
VPDIRVLPVHRGGSSKVHHYSATYWFRGRPILTRQGATADAAIAAMKRALKTAKRDPFSTANNVAGAATTIAAKELDKLNRKTYRKGKR